MDCNDAVRWSKTTQGGESESLCFSFFAHGGGPDHDALGYSKRALLNLLF